MGEDETPAPMLPGGPLIYRTRTGRVCAHWRITDWLRGWLDEGDVWALLESLSPRRLERFGRIVQAMRDADRDE